jgi:hypothetical protein
MFYGGRLLADISLDRDILEDLICVLKINQRAIVLIDSDKKNNKDSISDTKQRINKECSESGNICWITDGREIENYIPERVIVCAFEELIGTKIDISMNRYKKFDDELNRALIIKDGARVNYTGDKVKYAKILAKCFELSDIKGELKNHLDQIVEKIDLWNS